MSRKNYARGRECGAHTELDEHEAAIVYGEATSRKIQFSASYDSNQTKKIETIAQIINQHRTKSNKQSSRPEVTPSTIRSFLNHAYRQGLTLEDFT